MNPRRTMPKPEDRYDERPYVPPEQMAENVLRQTPTAPGADGDDEANLELDPQDEPTDEPDEEDVGPVADRALGPQALWDRQDGEPEAEAEGGEEGES